MKTATEHQGLVDKSLKCKCVVQKNLLDTCYAKRLPVESPYMTGRIDIIRKAGCLALGLAAFFAALDLSVAATNETPRLVSADLQQTNGPLYTMFKFCVGAGRANEGLRADWQRQLAVFTDF